MQDTRPDTRGRLLAAAAEEFARHGPRGARVAEIVRRAGVNERMIYHHFGSKAALYRAVLEDQGGGLRERWLPYLRGAETQPPREALRTAYVGYYLAFHARPLLGALLLHEAMEGWSARPALTAATLPPSLRAIYQRAQEEGVIRPDVGLPVFHATAVSALTTAPTVRGLFADTGRQLGEQIVELLLSGLVIRTG